MCNITEKIAAFSCRSGDENTAPEKKDSGAVFTQKAIFRYSEGVSFLYLRKIWEK